MPRTQSGHQGHTGQHHTLIVLASLPKMTLSPGKNSMYTPSSNRGMLHCPSTVQPSFCEKTFVRTACQKHGKQGKSYTLVWTTGLVPFLAQPATVTQNLPYIYIYSVHKRNSLGSDGSEFQQFVLFPMSCSCCRRPRKPHVEGQ